MFNFASNIINKMELIKNNFSISDLENLSGIKAHTIRIWEKRYGLLSPERTKTNIRSYSLTSLKKLLNVAYLNSNGYKISKIADFTEKEFNQAITALIEKEFDTDYYIQEFLLAMFTFDRNHFQQLNSDLELNHSFEQRVELYFIPLLKRIGYLWQSGVITPAHEHFIAVLIKEKLLLAIESVQSNSCESDEVYVLFLPEGELHDIGMYYIQYLLVKEFKQVIYLGASVPLNALESILDTSNQIKFVSSFTVFPEASQLESYLNDLFKLLLKGNKNHFYAWGNVLESFKNPFKKQMTLSYKLFKISDLI